MFDILAFILKQTFEKSRILRIQEYVLELKEQIHIFLLQSQTFACTTTFLF